jgi:diguanylate cyclase (GGDEF)-like protein/PAS domain S-box-containing protein
VAVEPEALRSLAETVFHRAPAAIAAIGLDGRLIWCNPAYGETVGVEVERLIGTDSTASVHPDDLEQAVGGTIRRMESDGSDTGRLEPIRMLRPDGRTVWVQFDSLLIEDGDQDPYVLASMTDVSAQIESEHTLAQSEAWFRAVLEHQSDIVTVIGFDGIVQYISPNCERLLGFTADELIGTPGLDTIHPEDRDALMEGFGEQLQEGKEARPFEYRQRRRDGSWLWLEATGKQVPEALGVDAVIVNARDITERHHADEAARAAQERFRVAFATSPLGIGFADLNGRLTWANTALAHTLGVSEDALVGMWFQDFSTEDELAHEIAETQRLLAGESDSFCCDKRYEHPDGRTVWARLHVSLVRDEDGAPAQLLGQLEDVTERKQFELSLAHDAMHDPLTGLLNRAGLRAQVDAAWGARRADEPMAILFGDLDGFKRVNDTLGHDAGDEVLVHVAQRLRTAVREGDVVARWGGDEFVVVCPSVTGIDDARRVADRIRDALEAPFRISPGSARIGVSLGVALDTGQPLPDLLLKDADAAAYRAKTNGRNHVVVSTPSTPS